MNVPSKHIISTWGSSARILTLLLPTKLFHEVSMTTLREAARSKTNPPHAPPFLAHLSISPELRSRLSRGRPVSWPAWSALLGGSPPQARQLGARRPLRPPVHCEFSFGLNPHLILTHSFPFDLGGARRRGAVSRAKLRRTGASVPCFLPLKSQTVLIHEHKGGRNPPLVYPRHCFPPLPLLQPLGVAPTRRIRPRRLHPPRPST